MHYWRVAGAKSLAAKGFTRFSEPAYAMHVMQLYASDAWFQSLVIGPWSLVIGHLRSGFPLSTFRCPQPE